MKKVGRKIAALAAAFAASLSAQNPRPILFIDTAAGGAKFDNLLALETPLINPQAVWAAASGDIYIADGNFLVRRIRDGRAAIVAGGGPVIDSSLPAPGETTGFDYP